MHYALIFVKCKGSLTQNIQQFHTLLIAGLTPSFLGKPDLWWKEHEPEILDKRSLTPLWRNNTLVIETGGVLAQNAFLRALADLGYEKTSSTLFPGTFKHLGSTILIFPVNHSQSFAVDFHGNTIESIEGRRDIEQRLFKPKPSRDILFREGDYVVHIDHGIGIFRGIVE